MKKVLLSFFVVVAFVFYSIYERQEATQVQTILPRQITPETQPSSQTTPTPSAASSSFKDGVFTGDRVDAFYGYIQVKATISGGQLSEIEFLEYPSDRRTSEMINTQAIPVWINEAIRAQSAEVDIVTGATDSSIAFRESLASALAQAE